MLVLVSELSLHSSSAEKMMNRLLISSFSYQISDLRSQISTREVGRDELIRTTNVHHYCIDAATEIPIMVRPDVNKTWCGNGDVAPSNRFRSGTC